MMQSPTTRSLLLAMILTISQSDMSTAFQHQQLSRFGLSRRATTTPAVDVLYSTETSNDAAFSAFADALEEGEERDEQQAYSSSSSSNGKSQAQNKSWQAKLEDLLDPATNMGDRQMLLSELLSSNEAIRESVLDALAKREIDPLLTPKQKKLQEGTRAVARQLANDIIPSLAANGRPRADTDSRIPSFPVPPVPSVQSLEKVGSRLFNVISNQVQTNLENLQEDLSDPLNRIPQRLSQQTEELVNEVQNVFLETPQGLTEPPYTVVDSSSEIYEIREYDGYTVASTEIEGFIAAEDDGSIRSSKENDLLGMGSAFNSLATYLLGANKEKKSMAMTTPVTTTSIGEMRFYLAELSDQIPEPNTGADQPEIKIVDIPPARLAVRKFTGFVTDGEVARQKDTLLSALEMDDVELDVDHGAIVPHVIFQYNPPYTLPMVRRNEIAIPVRPADVEGQTSLKQEWSVEDDGADASDSEVEDIVVDEASQINGSDDVSPSD